MPTSPVSEPTSSTTQHFDVEEHAEATEYTAAPTAPHAPARSAMIVYEEENLRQLADKLASCRTEGSTGLTIVITGANSGIGLVAAKLLAVLNPLHRLVLVARTREKAEYAKRQVAAALLSETGADPKSLSRGDSGSFVKDDCLNHLIPLECDHCSLDSVRALASELPKRLETTYSTDKWTYNGIDVLCLNAAVLVAEGSPPRFTKDGLETTFQTNHLAPFLLANLLYPYMNPGGRVVFTTSGLHLSCGPLDLSGALRCSSRSSDSDGNEGSDAENNSSFEVQRAFAMLDGTDFHYKRCYSLTKLCNVAVCVELHRRLQRSQGAAATHSEEPQNRAAPRPVVATCFSPGLMLDSDLFRHQQDPSQQLSTHLQQRETILRKAKSVAWGAGALVFVALSEVAGGQGCVYWNDDSLLGDDAVYGEHFVASPVTESVADEDQRRRLWDLSCNLAGIPSDLIS